MDSKDALARDSRDAELPTLMPPVDVIEDSAGITLYADLPGVTRDSLKLEMDAHTLTIEGEITLRSPDGLDSTHAEVSVPRYRRVFTLSNELDTEKLEAELKRLRGDTN